MSPGHYLEHRDNLISESLGVDKSDLGSEPIPNRYLSDRDKRLLLNWLEVLKIRSGQTVLDGGLLGKEISLHYEKVRGCNPANDWVYHGCSEGDYFVWRPLSPCNDHYCLMDSGRYGSKKGVDVFERLRAFESDSAYFVFTVPSEYWETLFDRKALGVFSEVCRETLYEFYSRKLGILKRDLLLGGVDRPHTWGDKTPENLGRKEPHQNVLMPLVYFNKRSKVFGVLPRWLNEADFALLRGLYRKNLIRVFGWKVDDVVVNYHYKPFRDPEVLMNACQYMMRPPLEVPLKRERFSGRGFDVLEFPYERLKEVYEHFKFYDGWTGLRYFGFMACCVLKKYLDLFGKSPSEVSRLISKVGNGLCPVCGRPLVELGRYSNNVLVWSRRVHWRDPSNRYRGFDFDVDRWETHVRIMESR